jgi:hypothetical protein
LKNQKAQKDIKIDSQIRHDRVSAGIRQNGHKGYRGGNKSREQNRERQQIIFFIPDKENNEIGGNQKNGGEKIYFNV